jgi:hypothetical protein
MFGFWEKEKMDEKYVWVAIIVRDGVNESPEYRGRIDRETFEKIANNEMTNGWFKMESTYWERDRKYVPQGQAGYEWGYSNTTYFRTEWIARIIVLTEDFVRSLTDQQRRH